MSTKPIAAPRMNFSAIDGSIKVSMSVSELSGRDKVNLFQMLMVELGIDDAFHQYPDETAFAAKLLIDRYQAHWG